MLPEISIQCLVPLWNLNELWPPQPDFAIKCHIERPHILLKCSLIRLACSPDWCEWYQRKQRCCDHSRHTTLHFLTLCWKFKHPKSCTHIDISRCADCDYGPQFYNHIFAAGVVWPVIILLFRDIFVFVTSAVLCFVLTCNLVVWLSVNRKVIDDFLTLISQPQRWLSSDAIVADLLQTGDRRSMDWMEMKQTIQLAGKPTKEARSWSFCYKNVLYSSLWGLQIIKQWHKVILKSGGGKGRFRLQRDERRDINWYPL